jgi:hypothetical protein
VVRDAASDQPAHVLALATLGAAERRRLRDRRSREVAPEPRPALVTTARATVVDARPVVLAEAERWLADAGPKDAAAALSVVARAVRAHRLASRDPAVHEPALSQALVVRVGHGAGEQVAEGRWSAARELPPTPVPRRGRAAGLQPQERVAELLGGHARPFACEELTLRARYDVDRGQLREGALQLRAALAAALGELTPPPAGAADMSRRLEELQERRTAVDAFADQAARGPLPATATGPLTETLERLEAIVRAQLAGYRNPQAKR